MIKKIYMFIEDYFNRGFVKYNFMLILIYLYYVII